MNKKHKLQPDISYVYEIRITLKGSDPSIWRTVLVEKNITLGELHHIIQDAMGWENEHLHQFRVKKHLYGPIDFDERMPGEKDEDMVDIQKLVLDKTRKLEYEYDFGDGWIHEIEILRRVPYDESILYPVCIGGERACPPEDSGGIWRFTEKLAALEDPGNSDHEETKDWLGEFDPNYFHMGEVNERLQAEAPEIMLDDAVEGLHDSMVDAFSDNCGFCGKDIEEEQEVYSLGVQIKEGFDVKEWEGEIIPFKVAGIKDPVLGFATPKESDANKAGNDIVFQLCGDKCVQNLQAALKEGFSIYIPDDLMIPRDKDEARLK